MGALSTALRYEMFFVLTALAAIIAYRLLTRQINTRGLLRDKAHRRRLSPGRLQLLVVTLAVAAYYVAEVFTTQEMPAVPGGVLLALGGSHLLYLGGKAYELLAGRLERAAARIAGSSGRNLNGG